MGLLAPLYALAALAIVGPILFHLIKRQPRGQRVFSSLMFLSPSPPTLTRRSRLDNLLLLLLRALAIALVAFAFARPYWRTNSLLSSNLEGRRIAVVLDTSASMQRPDVWQKATQSIERLMGELSPGDRVALYTLDSRLNSIVPMEEEPTRPAAESVQAVQQALPELEPTWRASELAEGLKELADQMSAAMLAGDEKDPTDNQIVLVTDLHEDSGLGSLQGYPWPENVRLEVRQVQPDTAGNARLSLVRSDESLAGVGQDVVKVRVDNNANSIAQAFELYWQNERGQVAGTPVQVQVTAGQSRVVPVGTQPPGSDRLVLRGDPWEADNELLMVAPETTQGVIAFVGPESEQTEERLDYFLEQAPLGTQYRERSVERIQPHEFQPALAEVDALVYQPFDDIDGFAPVLKQYVLEGGTAIIVLARPLVAGATDSDALVRFLRDITGNDSLTIQEGDKRDFALIGRIDYTHPMFVPFADPRFNDFSKLRFWSHRRVQGLTTTSSPEAVESLAVATNNAAAGTARIVASFDDQSPFLIEQSLGQGKIWVVAAGWQPTASTFALSSKFVPIMLQMLDPELAGKQTEQTFEVGQAIAMGKLLGTTEVDLVDGQSQPLSPALYELTGDTLTFQQPGMYFAKAVDDRRWPLAVHVPSRESQLEPLDLTVFEQYGVPLGRVESDVERRETERQRSAVELENQQRIWQWLILAGLVVLAVETLAAGLLARRATAATVA